MTMLIVRCFYFDETTKKILRFGITFHFVFVTIFQRLNIEQMDQEL